MGPVGRGCRHWYSSALQLCQIRARRAEFAVVLATIRRPENWRCRLVIGPGGTPQEISRGQARFSGRGPRFPRRTGHAPAGHRRSFWRRPSRSSTLKTRRLGPVGPAAVGQPTGPFLRCPAGARSHWARVPGAAAAGADLPPANLLWRPSGTGTTRPRTDHGKPPAPEWRFQVVRWPLCRSVLQLFRILARREDFTVARPASSARQFVPSHSRPQIPLPNSAALTNRSIPSVTLGVRRAIAGRFHRLLPSLRSFRSLRCSTPRRHDRSVS